MSAECLTAGWAWDTEAFVSPEVSWSLMAEKKTSSSVGSVIP